MTPTQSAKLVALLLAAFPNARAHVRDVEATSSLYERMLADLDVNAATAAAERLIATSKFLPSIAEIREAALSLAVGDNRPGGDAWGDVLAAVRRFGQYRGPTFDDPIVGRVVSALGWRELCQSENQHADRARFIELYDRFAASARTETLTAGLPSGERYRQLRASGEALPLSAAVGRLLGDVEAVQ